MKMQNPHYLIHTEMNDATRSAYARLKRKGAFGMTFDGLANLYAATLDYIGERELKEGTSAEEIAADLLAIMINEKSLPDILRDDNVDTKQISAAVVGEVNAAWQDIGRATRAASNAMQDALTNADGLDDFAEKLDVMLDGLKKSALEAYSSLHVIEAAKTPRGMVQAAIFGSKPYVMIADILDELDGMKRSATWKEKAVLTAAEDIVQNNADVHLAAGNIRSRMTSATEKPLPFAEAKNFLSTTLDDAAGRTSEKVIKALMDIIKQDEAARNGEAHVDAAGHDAQEGAQQDDEESAADIIREAICGVVGYPADGTTVDEMLDGTLDDLEAIIDDDETKAIFDAARIILDGEDDGDPADTMREQLCSIVGYATDGKTDAMLDDILDSLAKKAPNRETEALIEAARDIMKDSANA